MRSSGGNEKGSCKIGCKKAEAKQKRWQSIAESAAKQSRRNIIPHIHEVVKFGQAVDYAKNLDITLIPYELAEDMEKTKQIFETIQPGQSIGIFIGPEGGFDESEIALAQENGISDYTGKTDLADGNCRYGGAFGSDVSVGGQRIMQAYLDNSATTRCSEGVRDIVVKVMMEISEIRHPDTTREWRQKNIFAKPEWRLRLL